MKFGFYSILLRWFLIGGIVLGTYNPSGRSYVHWAMESEVEFSLKLSVGLVLLSVNVALLNIVLRSLGYVGFSLMTASLTSIAVTLWHLEWVRLYTWEQTQLYIIVFFVCAVTIGVCWSAIRTRLSGQVDSDDISRRL